MRPRPRAERGGTDEQDGPPGAHEHLARYAAEVRRPVDVMAARRDDDEVGSDVIGGPYDLL
jgi:hypothetical protein